MPTFCQDYGGKFLISLDVLCWVHSSKQRRYVIVHKGGNMTSYDKFQKNVSVCYFGRQTRRETNINV